MKKTRGKTNTQGSVSEDYATLFTDFDIALFKNGVHYKLYEKLGAHLMSFNGEEGTYFAVWAPNAAYVSLVGDFNFWQRDAHKMNIRYDGSGIWELFVPHVGAGALYKFFVRGENGFEAEKADPFAFQAEEAPRTASVVTNHSFIATRKPTVFTPTTHALSVYELHLGSWRRKDGNTLYSYRELAAELPEYCAALGFTHVELMPAAEHPFYGSWGYQITGYFAPTSRFGTPDDFAFLVDELHKRGIGVILDWVPSHFPTDEHGLGYFDGTHLFEHADPRKGFHPDWQSNIFNLGRNEVRAFLISNALFWLDRFGIDGLRVDAVASMLYLDYSRKHGEWLPNEFGGRENLESVAFFREFNNAVHQYFPNALTIAEESTAWPGVTKPAQDGGLGFDLKWMMGWMHDTLNYFQKDPIHRKYHHDTLTFSIFYAFSERFVLPLSHDEVVHGKYSLLKKMPGDEWQQFANLRLLFGYMFGHPGAKLLFMGAEFGQSHEWRHDYGLDMHEAENSLNKGVGLLLHDLNRLYRTEAMQQDFELNGFEWLDFNDRENSVISWIRKGKDGSQLIFVYNFTPVVRHNYRLGMPQPGVYAEILNTDDLKYGGSGVSNGSPETAPIARHGRTHSVSLSLPPLGVIVLQRTGDNF